MTEEQVDVLIIGGGLTGASVLLALQGSPWRCRMVDNRAFDTDREPSLDARSLALAPASMRILQQLGIAEDIRSRACAIDTIHVSQQGQFGHTRLHAKSEALGHVIEMNQLNRIVLAALDAEHITAPATFEALNAEQSYASINVQGLVKKIHYKLLIAADGSQSAVRQALGMVAKTTDYHQHAIITNVALKRDHAHQAYERFTDQGPLAMLPLQDQRAAMVWALTPERAHSLMELSPAAFTNELQQGFGYRLGRLQTIGQRSCIPLQMVVAKHSVQGNVVLIGSAAQHLHPVAGQGFNLALRDVATLAQCLYASSLQPEALRAYEEMRQTDRRAICRFTDGLVRLFGMQVPGMSSMRGAALLAFDNLPILQNTMARYARGFAGQPPDLACGLSLSGEMHAL